MNCENPKGSSLPTHIPNVWLLSSIAVVADKLTHCPNTASVFCHGCSTVLPRHNCIFCTFLLYFQHWPIQWYYWRQVWSLQISRFVGSFWCIFSAHRERNERTVKRQTVFLGFFVLSSWYHALPYFSRGWTDLLGIDLPSELSRSQSVGLSWTSDRPLAEISDSTQHSQKTDTYAAGGIRTHSPCNWLSQTHAFDRAATGIGLLSFMSWVINFTLQHFAYMLLSVLCLDSTHSHKHTT